MSVDDYLYNDIIESMSTNFKSVVGSLGVNTLGSDRYGSLDSEKHILSACDLEPGAWYERRTARPRISRIGERPAQLHLDFVQLLSVGTRFIDDRRMYFHEASGPEVARRGLPNNDRERWIAERPAEEEDPNWIIVRKDLGGVAVDLSLCLEECSIQTAVDGAPTSHLAWAEKSLLIPATERSDPQAPVQV